MHQIFKWKRKYQRLLRLSLVIFISIFVCSESADWIACNIGSDPGRGKSCAVLVLGYPSSSDGKPDPVQEVRVAAGVRGYRHYNCDRTFVTVEYQLNGRWWWKILSASYALFAWGRDLLLF